MPENKISMLIAGPCSAESEKLCMDTAEQILSKTKIDIFRAGIWKPRSLHNTYKGPQNEGLKYLVKVQQEFGIPVATEVGTAQHVKACIQAGINYVWLGARSVANPFTVDELAEEIQGTGLKVMVKNPIVADFHLWAGAVDKLLSRNIEITALIHRGFATYDETVYRNEPLWSIFAEMKSRFPNIPILADPSHMAGKAAYIPILAQEAIDMEADGLMIEVHADAKNALSDAAQQISPEDFHKLMESLRQRTTACCDGISIQELREELDETDERLIKILAQRLEIIRRMGQIKKENNISVLQFDRWREVFANRLATGEKSKIDRDFLKGLLKSIHDESLRIQLEIMNGGKEE